MQVFKFGGRKEGKCENSSSRPPDVILTVHPASLFKSILDLTKLIQK